MVTYSQCLMLLSITNLCNSLQCSETFTIIRGEGDIFSNQGCDSTTSCPHICERYDANCYSTDEGNPCKLCSCTQNKQTYVGNWKDGGKCVSDADLVQESVPKKRVRISSCHLGRSLCKCLSVDLAMILGDNCFDTKEYSWIYTSNRRFMDLNRLECLTVGKMNKVTISPCMLSGENQTWYCDASNMLLFQEKNASRMYIDTNLTITTSNHSLWQRFKARQDKSSTCPQPAHYQGCYRLNDGSLIRNLLFNPIGQCASGQGCFTEIKILAPIYKENAKCSINWKTSTYLTGNKPWQNVATPDKNISVSNPENSRGIFLKIPYTSYGKWPGVVLKLQVNCSSDTSSEEHCVLVKFPSNEKKRVYPSDGAKKRSNESSAYKISTIVLSSIFFITLFSIAAYFAIRSKMCKKIKQRRERVVNGIAEIPFCSETDVEQ